MDLGAMVQEILSTVGNFLNNILGMVINLFNTFFSFLPPNLRTGFGVVVLIVVGVIIFFLWNRD
jgi:hypothetical protein